MWQDLVFPAGSVFSILVLSPTLTDHTARVPLGTSLLSAALGVVYGASFYTMGMLFPASGSLLTGVLWASVLWAAIAALRSLSLSNVLPEATPELETRLSD